MSVESTAPLFHISSLSAMTFASKTASFAALNGVVSVACWKLLQRPVVAWTGAFSSLLALFGLTLQLDRPALANGYVAVASLHATVQYSMLLAKTPSLRNMHIGGIVYGGWLLGTAAFAAGRLRWVAALWGDA